MTDILFTYMNERCHAQVVDELSIEPTARNFIGKLDGYEIYKTDSSIILNQFGFEAIKSKP